jgi:hypothetical protein
MFSPHQSLATLGTCAVKFWCPDKVRQDFHNTVKSKKITMRDALISFMIAVEKGEIVLDIKPDYVNAPNRYSMGFDPNTRKVFIKTPDGTVLNKSPHTIADFMD